MRQTLLLPGTLLVLMSCAQPDAATEGETDSKIAPSVVAAASEGQQALVLVELADSSNSLKQGLTTDTPGMSDADLELRETELTAVKNELRSEVPGLTEEREYSHLPLMAVTVSDLSQLKSLAANPKVVRVHENATFTHQLAQSLPLINQPSAAAQGYSGAGVTVAVLDTGLDYRKTDFGSCTAPGVPAGCKVSAAIDFAANDNALDDNGHGTNVAGIVLGVAPGAKVVGLDVFTGGGAYSADIISAINWCIANRNTYNIVAINMSLGGGASSTQCGNDVFASAVTAAKNAGILSAIASGNNGYSSMISSPACVPDAVSVGAVYDSALGGLNWSACQDATTAADQVTCFSNSASFLTLLAPGSMITAAGITMSGTSQATPHVAGALAVLAAAFPQETVAQRIERLTTSTKSVRDARNGVIKPRLDLAAATGACLITLSATSASVPASGGTVSLSLTASSGSCAWAVSTPPTWLTAGSAASGTGSTTVVFQAAPNFGVARSTTLTVAGRSVTVSQAGDAVAPQGTAAITPSSSWTKTATVTLALSASDNGGVASMCIANTATCTTWKAYATTTKWTLASGNGLKTIYAYFKDAAGNVSAATTVSIGLDATAPTNGALTATGGDARISLSWSGFADATSGIASYKVVGALNTAPSSCSAGTVIYTGTGLETTHAVSNGATWGYRVCAIDAAANISTGVAASARAAPEYVVPVGTVRVAGSGVTKVQAVTLTLAATDASGVASMCLSNTATCSAWVAYSTSANWSLASASGTKTVYAWFRDMYGNVSAPATATVLLDMTAPTLGTLTATAGTGQVALAWSGISDALTGVARYTLVYAVGTTSAPTCAVGAVAYSGTATNYTLTGLTAGRVVAFRLCATDGAGNTSAGVVKTATPL